MPESSPLDIRVVFIIQREEDKTLLSIKISLDQTEVVPSHLYTLPIRFPSEYEAREFIQDLKDEILAAPIIYTISS